MNPSNRLLFERLLKSKSLIQDYFTLLVPRPKEKIKKREQYLEKLVELASHWHKKRITFHPIERQGVKWSTIGVYQTRFKLFKKKVAEFTILGLLDAIYFSFLIMNLMEYFKEKLGEVYIRSEGMIYHESGSMKEKKLQTAQKVGTSPSTPSKVPTIKSKGIRGPPDLEIIRIDEFFSYQRIPISKTDFRVLIEQFCAGQSETYDPFFDGERTYITRMEERIPVLVTDEKVFYPEQFHPLVQRDAHLGRLCLHFYQEYPISTYPALTDALYTRLKGEFPDLIRGFAAERETIELWVSDAAKKVFCKTTDEPALRRSLQFYRDWPNIPLDLSKRPPWRSE
ncbi:MAG: hypothetical protein EU536_00735 [Promethearchaeota archaeon]|nr:MAG: hypothetical protein EU536_00735 [Candidatus Lokiarchaeota archaeon]